MKKKESRILNSIKADIIVLQLARSLFLCFFFLFYFVEEDEENDLQNRSLTPYPFLCPEFWEHYNYLKEFHDLHTGAFHLQQQHQVQISVTSADATYTAHVLNTIAEEAAEEDKSAAFAIDEKDNKSDSECEVTVTVTLPTRKVEMNIVEEQTSNSPIDFWQQINDDGDEPALKERTDTAETSEGEGSSKSSASSDSVSYYEDEVEVVAFAKSLSTTSSDDDNESSEATDVDASEKSSPSTFSDESDPSEDIAVCDASEKSSSTSEVTTSDADETSSDSGDSSEENATPSPQSDSSHKFAKDQAVTVRPSTPPSSAVYLLEVVIGEGDGGRRKSEEDADSGITTWSADISRQISEKDVQNVGGGGVIETAAKKYQRTGTHSRLFDFLQRDDYSSGAAASGPNNNKSLQLSATADLPSSCTSGYSSAATTPTTPSVSGIRGRYESDTARAEYDSYYNSWEYACPYFGYDILPSKAFKTIAQQQQQGQGPASIKFKCPKIPTGQNKY